MKNTPYIKKLDSNGNVINPITKNNPYLNPKPNRKQRREHLNQTRFIGNGKNHHLTINKMGKFHRVQQVIQAPEFKIIEHYLP